MGHLGWGTVSVSLKSFKLLSDFLTLATVCKFYLWQNLFDYRKKIIISCWAITGHLMQVPSAWHILAICFSSPQHSMTSHHGYSVNSHLHVRNYRSPYDWQKLKIYIKKTCLFNNISQQWYAADRPYNHFLIANILGMYTFLQIPQRATILMWP